MTGPATESKNRYFRMGFALETDADLMLIMAVTSAVKVFSDDEPLSVPTTDKVEWGWPGLNTVCHRANWSMYRSDFFGGDSELFKCAKHELEDAYYVQE